MKFIKGKERHVFAAGKYTTGGLILVPYSTNLTDVAVEGKGKVPRGAFIQVRILRKEFGGSAFIATSSAAAQKATLEFQQETVARKIKRMNT